MLSGLQAKEGYCLSLTLSMLPHVLRDVVLVSDPQVGP